MREIKVRAWTGTRMLYKKLHDHSWYSASNGGKHVCEHNQNHERIFKTMLFTGLKDKNGTEIYEGDIVKYEDRIPMEVGFKKGCFMTITVMPYSPLYRNEEYKYGPCEVIGNIYENPELLGGDK